LMYIHESRHPNDPAILYGYVIYPYIDSREELLAHPLADCIMLTRGLDPDTLRPNNDWRVEANFNGAPDNLPYFIQALSVAEGIIRDHKADTIRDARGNTLRVWDRVMAARFLNG